MTFTFALVVVTTWLGFVKHELEGYCNQCCSTPMIGLISVLRALHVGLELFVMLIAMTFNTALFLTIVVGAGMAQLSLLRRQKGHIGGLKKYLLTTKRVMLTNVTMKQLNADGKSKQSDAGFGGACSYSKGAVCTNPYCVDENGKCGGGQTLIEVDGSDSASQKSSSGSPCCG